MEENAMIAMTDQELIESFENGTLSNECFHHREHVRVAFLYVSQYAVLEALQRFSKALRRFAALHGKPQLYHETITWAYVLLIQERVARAEKKQDWDEFAQCNPDLLQWKDGILSRYYHAETLKSELARAVFVFPDLSYENRAPEN
jgi:hypothetical protein